MADTEFMMAAAYGLDIEVDLDTEELSDLELEEITPLDEKEWLVWVKGGDPVGPVSATQLARGIRAGKVPSDARIKKKPDVFWSDVLAQPDVIAALKAVVPADKPTWFVWAEGGEVVGPVSASQLARGIRAGKVPADAKVQRVGTSTWSDLASDPDIAAAMKA